MTTTRSYNIYLREFPTTAEFDECSTYINSAGLLTRVNKFVPSAHRGYGYTIYLPEAKGSMIIYNRSDTDICTPLQRLITKFHFDNLGIYNDRASYYLGELMKEYGLHMFFARGEREELEQTDNLQHNIKNFAVVVKLESVITPDEFQEAMRYAFFEKAPTETTRRSYYMYPNIRSAQAAFNIALENTGLRSYSTQYEVPELVLAQRLYRNLRNQLTQLGPIDFMKEFHSDITSLDSYKINTQTYINP